MLNKTPLSNKQRKSVLDNLKSPDYKKRYQSIQIIAEYPEPQLLSALIDFLREDRDLKIEAAKVFGILRSREAVPALIETLGSDDEWLAAVAAEALEKIKDIRSVPALIEALRSDQALKLIAEARKRKNIKDVLPLAQYIWDISELRAISAEALGQIASDEAIAAIAETLYDTGESWRGVQNTAVLVLEQIGTPKALNLLKVWRQQAFTDGDMNSV